MQKNEESGKIPKKEIGENNINKKQLDYYEKALQYIKTEYVKIFDLRYSAKKNITVIQGDLHPGHNFMSDSPERTVKFENFVLGEE
jgi:hypothetical protein